MQKLILAPLIAFSLKKCVKKSCPNSIPRSSAAAAAINCFSVTFSLKDNSPFLLLSGMRDNKFIALEWSDEEEKFVDERNISTSEIIKYSVEIRHYFGFSEFRYYSYIKFLTWQIFHIYYIIILFNNIKQSIFNFRTPHRVQSEKILEFLVEMRCSGSSENFSPFNSPKEYTILDIVRGIYGFRIFSHPSYNSIIAYTRMAVESLVMSGDLQRKDNISYYATGKALDTLRNFEESNRRHNDARLSNKIMAYLTAALVLASFIQAFASWK